MSLADETPPHSPSTDHLSDIFYSGNYERLESEASRVLAIEPEDEVAHYYSALALIELERIEEALIHVEFLQKVAPEDIDTHLVSARFFISSEKWSAVDFHTKEGIRLDPENDVFHFYAAVVALTRLKLSLAKKHIDEARRLDPDDADYAHLAIRIQGIEESSAEEAWLRIGELRGALRLDPQNAEIHNSVGDVYLDELDDPKEAEIHYREALRIDPLNRRFQRDLFHAVAKRNIIYRIVSVPSRTMGWMRDVLRAIGVQPWKIIFLLLGIEFVFVFVVWLVMAIIVFWPAGKIYEWLLVSELKKGSATSFREIRIRNWFQRWPRALRFLLYLVLIAGIQACLIHYLLGMSLSVGFVILGIFVGIHAAVILAIFAMRRMRVLFAKKMTSKSRARE